VKPDVSSPRIEPSLKATNIAPMAQTLVSFYVHLIFSTKNRLDLVDPEIEPSLFAYMGGIANNNGSKLISAGGTANHVHLLVSLSKNLALSELVGDIKRDSSVWIKEKGIKYSRFRWQDGYGAFSVGYTHLNAVKKYIATQKRHHAEAIRR
jgi:REP element-mobilizing transposase RayT